jgi:hypothetical protein
VAVAVAVAPTFAVAISVAIYVPISLTAPQSMYVSLGLSLLLSLWPALLPSRNHHGVTISATNSAAAAVFTGGGLFGDLDIGMCTQWLPTQDIADSDVLNEVSRTAWKRTARTSTRTSQYARRTGSDPR